MAEKDVPARLRRAVMENKLFLVKRLIQRTDMRNPDPSNRRYTSLAWAAVMGHEETFEFLLSAGHDEEEISKDSDNNTILILLAEGRPGMISPYRQTPDDRDFIGAALRMAMLYYERYPDTLDWANSQGKTALHVAALKGNEELVRMLCDLGADYDLPDNQGNTALHYASAWGHIPVVQLLIERGCQFTARNNQGFTPSDYAYSFSTRETLQDTARIQFENNKKARRNVYAQAAQRGHELGNGPSTVPPPAPTRMPSGLTRMRSTSRSTAETSDSGDFERPSLATARSLSSMSNTSSPSQPHPSTYLHATTSPSNGTTSLPKQSPGPSSSVLTSSTLVQNGSGSSHSALSPIASRTRDRDAAAIDKYLKGTRNRSGSADTASTDARSQSDMVISAGPATNGNPNFSSAGPSADGDDLAQLQMVSLNPRRRVLRPSNSASQLQTLSQQSADVLNSDALRSRSGTNPTQTNVASSATPTDRQSFGSPTQVFGQSFARTPPGSQQYAGPPEDYARFPEPPNPPSTERDAPSTKMPTSRRLPFNLLAKPPANSDQPGHRRGNSATALSMRGS